MGCGDPRAERRDLAQPEGVSQTSKSRCPDELKKLPAPTQKCINTFTRVLALLKQIVAL